MDWKKFGYLIASKNRMKITKSLAEKPKTPKEISKELGLYISHVSSTLSQLEKTEIVKCHNPEQKRGKLFYLTQIGKDLEIELRGRNNLME